MYKYTKEDVIIWPDDPRLKGALDKACYAADAPLEALLKAKVDIEQCTLVDINTRALIPFKTFYKGIPRYYPVIIIKKEPTYAERQAEWIKENDIKIGDKVRVTRKAESKEKGWNGTWAKPMDSCISLVCEIEDIDDFGVRCDLFYFPYFVLEKVTKKYVPFDLSDPEIKKSLRGRWIIAKNGREECEINRFDAFIEHKGIWTVNGMSAEHLFNNYTFDDGTPCGKEVWE